MKGLLFLLFFPLIGFSQAEASHWYFGNGAGLIFDVNAGTVTSTNAASGTINTSEGCSSISDFNGNLLFYTDGRNIWDKNYTIMPNANYAAGTGLMGDPSSTSSGLIIPKPGNNNQYYVFTVDEPHHQNAYAFPNQGPANAAGNPVGTYDSGGSVPNADDGFNNGLAYTLVDLSLNAGNGDVVTSEKNIQLTTYDPSIQSQSSYKCSEKITAVEHNDGQSYWVVTHFRDRFYSFRVQASGVNTTAVVTTTTTLISELGYRRNAIGYMKASPDGTKIALCHRQNGTVQGQNTNNTGSVMLYDFDNATGLVSNPTNLYPNSGPYGVEFSQESTKLYVTANQSVIQFDLESANPAQTINTVYNGFDFIGALQLGPDGKIYVANTDNYATMDVINAPDEAGVLCDYTYAGITLAPGTTGVIGLPPFIQSFFLASIVFENACVDQSTLFDVNSSQDFDSILWTFGDGTGTSNENSPSHTYTSAGTYTVTAEITSGTEVNTFTETIIISENPIANPIDDINVCDEDGIVSFDFVGPETQILGMQNPVSFNVKFYATQYEAETNENPLSLPYQNTAASETIFVRIENTANSSCFDTTAFQLTVFDSPTANAVAEFEVCDDLSDGDDANGQTEILLTNFDSEVIGTQDPALFEVSYHESLAEAQTNTNPLSSPYYNTSPFNYQIFVRLQNTLKTDCFDTTEFTVNVYATPTANLASDLEVCDDDEDGVVAFDFAEIQTQILGGQDATNFNLTYHSSLNEAETNENPLSLPYQNTAASETIFVRIENTANSSCFDTTAFQLTVFDSPTANAVAEFEVCDDLSDGDDANGQTEILLTNFDSEVIGTQDPALFEVSYHESLAEAQTNTNPLSSPYYNTSPFNYQIFVRLQNTLKTDCFDTTEFTVNVYATPTANLASDLEVCDDDEDGVVAFDFAEIQTQILGGQDATNFNLTYHSSLNEAETSENPLSLPYQNTAASETIFVRIENTANSSCFDTTAFQLTVFDSPTANAVAEFEVCDDLSDGDDANGQTEILLTNFDSEVIGTQDPALFEVSYHESLAEAQTNTNPLSSPYYNTSPFNYQIFVRLQNTLKTDCFDTTEFTVNVYATPTANLASDLEVCDDDEDGVVAFDFAEIQTQILGGQDATNFNLTYHSSLNEAETNENPLSLPYQNTAASETIFVRIENTANSSCFDTTAFQLTVFDSPTANAVAEFEVCDDLSDGDDANGQTEILLTNFDSEVIGTQDPALFEVSYHESLAEAQTNTNPLSSPYYNTSPFNYQIFVRLQNTLKTDCFDTTEFTVNVYAIPQALNANLIQCDEDGTNDGLTTFNLSEANATLSGASPDRTIRFYLTFDNAENSTDEITAAGFTNTINPQTIYAQVIDDNSGCFNISELTLDVSLTSGLDANLTTCDDDGTEDGFALFNLTTATPTILSGLPADYNLEYYETYQDALLEQNPLGQNFTNTIAYNQTIFARIENNNQCYGLNELNLSVFELPVLHPDDETFFCIDSNSPTVFIDSGIIGNPSDFSFLWSSGQTSDEIEISQGGTYAVTVTNANGCTQTKSITVVNSNIATIESIEINDVSANNTVTVIATGEGDYEYALDDVLGPYQSDNTFYNVTPGFHTVYVRDKNNCGIADQIISVIGFPNFFTPNDDGYNDSWHVYGINTPSQAGSKIYIFDRYGKLLKELSYNSLGWDGTYNGNPMPTSDYWFYIKLNDNRIFRGHFTLKR